MHLITNPSDIYYLTWIRPHDPGEILIIYSVSDSQHRNLIFCDARTSGCFDAEKYEIIADRKMWGEKMKTYAELSTDPDFLTQTLREKIEWYGVKLLMKKSPITESRILKTSAERELLQISQKMNRQVYDMIVPFLIPWVTEESIARKIQILQLELWASGSSFPPIVAFGENTAIPHHSPTQRVLQSDDVVLLDMGLMWQWYCSDMTRCTQIQSIKYKVQKDGFFDEIYDLLQHVTNTLISWAKPGMKVADLDTKAREMLGEYEKYFTHSLGHGVGIDIHEAPHISKRSDEILEPWMIITIEPWIYIPGKYGARYEEMVVVDKDKLLVL